MRILLIEDDREIERLMVDVLADAGIDARSAADAERIDGVITDLVSLDGYDAEAARAYVDVVRARHRVPVIVVTAHAGAAFDGAARLGADDVIAKPFDIDVFVSRVRAVLSRPAGPTHQREGVRSRDWEPAFGHR